MPALGGFDRFFGLAQEEIHFVERLVIERINGGEALHPVERRQRRRSVASTRIRIGQQSGIGDGTGHIFGGFGEIFDGFFKVLITEIADADHAFGQHAIGALGEPILGQFTPFVAIVLFVVQAHSQQGNVQSLGRGNFFGNRLKIGGIIVAFLQNHQSSHTRIGIGIRGVRLVIDIELLTAGFGALPIIVLRGEVNGERDHPRMVALRGKGAFRQLLCRLSITGGVEFIARHQQMPGKEVRL